jgi:hypothetical protein
MTDNHLKPTWRPCTPEEWDNRNESDREIIDFKDGKGFQLCVRVKDE